MFSRDKPKSFAGHLSKSKGKNERVDSVINVFEEWFTSSLVPEVSRQLTDKGLKPKVLLLLDNCSVHPSENEFISEDDLGHSASGPGSSGVYEKTLPEMRFARVGFSRWG